MKGQLTISTAPTSQLGPRMTALNERQRLFVTCILTQAKRDQSAAAAAAGYEGTVETLRVTGHRLMHDKRVLAAMREEGERRMDYLSLIAIEKLGDTLENTTDERTRLKAVDMVLNRTGFHATTEHINKNETIKSPAEKIAEVVSLAKLLGVDPRTLLGRSAPKEVTHVASVLSDDDHGGIVHDGSGGGDVGQIVDAEFVETSTEGLEDLL